MLYCSDAPPGAKQAIPCGGQLPLGTRADRRAPLAVGRPATMDAATLAQYEQMLGALMSTDNSTRNAAEEALNQAKQSPDGLFTALITMLRRNADEQVCLAPQPSAALPPAAPQQPSASAVAGALSVGGAASQGDHAVAEQRRQRYGPVCSSQGAAQARATYVHRGGAESFDPKEGVGCGRSAWHQHHVQRAGWLARAAAIYASGNEEH